MLRDLTHIGRAIGRGRATRAKRKKQAYAEVVEYVRVGVQLIHDELIDAARRRRPLTPTTRPESDDDPSVSN